MHRGSLWTRADIHHKYETLYFLRRRDVVPSYVLPCDKVEDDKLFSKYHMSGYHGVALQVVDISETPTPVSIIQVTFPFLGNSVTGSI